VDDFRDRGLPRVCFLKPHATGIEREQHSTGTAMSGDVACGPQQTNELGAMHLAEGASHEPPLLRRYENVAAGEATTTHHDAVVEGPRNIELVEMRAHGALLGPDELDETLRVEQPGDTLAGGGFVPMGLGRFQQATHDLPSISWRLCIRRSM